MKTVLRTIVKRPYVCATCKRKKGELPVHGELAYTPAEMFEMWKQGVPISNDNLGTPTFEPDKTVWNIPIERQRVWILPTFGRLNRPHAGELNRLVSVLLLKLAKMYSYEYR